MFGNVLLTQMVKQFQNIKMSSKTENSRKVYSTKWLTTVYLL